MLELKLRAEFLSAQMPGTQISLQDYVASDAERILAITYPTTDVRNALWAISVAESRPVVLIGDRGRGKSHIMAVLDAAFRAPAKVQTWAAGWAAQIGEPGFGQLNLPQGFQPISVVMSDQEHRALWDPIFAALPNGQRYLGRFQASGAPVPARTLLEEMLASQPAALLLDELQTWYDTLPSAPGGAHELAFNFIQILSEVASSRPELLRLVLSVRNSETDAYRQVHRNNPVLVDFKGASARTDRIRLTQHRLFENYRQIPSRQIDAAVVAYAGERIRLLYPTAAGPHQDELRKEVHDCWPFAPELMGVLEDEILMAAAAQETRDLMRILVRLFKARGEAVPLLTVADFSVTSEHDGSADLASMVDVVAGNGSKLRQVAQRNCQSILEQGLALPHAVEMLSALWVRSLSAGLKSGATQQQLHLDITRDQPVDDNAYADELERLKAASFNVHLVGERLVFRVEENPRAKLVASAKNDKQFDQGQDLEYLQRTILHLLSPADAAMAVVSRIVVLGPSWESQPWTGLTADERPDTWREPVVMVLPEYVADERLARWLTDHVPGRRNLVRFLLPQMSRPSPYADGELRQLARCTELAETWGKTDAQYKGLVDEFRKPLREKLGKWFDRLAVLSTWDYQQSAGTRFNSGNVPAGPDPFLKRAETFIVNSVFDTDEYRSYVRGQAEKGATVYHVLADLMDPPSSPESIAIPFLGEKELYERMLLMVAAGDLIVNVKGTWVRREPADADDASALARINQKAYLTGKDLQNVTLGMPASVPYQPPVPPPVVQQPLFPGRSSGVGPLSPGSETGPETPETGLIYGSGSSGSVGGERPVREKLVKTFKSGGPRTKANLQGDLFQWQIDTKQIQAVRLSIPQLSPAQLKELISKLPPTIQLELEVDVADGFA